ncbi:CLUMA_CG001960, isoform A [Clunio marinus]|uniref:Twinfilin n=1 Tax=Clunio marinus TaxID=568069 RepID=A0A1J1HJG4_9DIPT|nr:CLUMA_CG001960, isoform A [Clunio marinus]
MSHRTGIKSNADLLKFFGKCKDGKTRLVKVSIENEELTLVSHKEVKKDWEKDFDKLIQPEIEDDVPCYILYRLDTKTAEGAYAWMLISWIPDISTIRQKMIYASTKSTLKLEFGSSYLKEEYHATSLEEITFTGYQKNKLSMAAPTPLTRQEEERNELRRTEVKTEVGVDTRHQTLGGINCPISEAALQAINDLKRGSYNYLQFNIDLDKEEIHIAKAENIDVHKLKALVPIDHARFHVFLFKHSYDGDWVESLVFIYSVPGYNCSVKERMLYSSSKAPFLETLQGLGIDITKRLEIDDASEVSEENLIDEIHPKKMLHKTQFAKPAPPSKNRGPRRLIK